jgi:integrase
MRWQDISQEPTAPMDSSQEPPWWWTIPGEHTKNKRPHRVPLTSMAVEIIKAAKGTANLRGFDTSTWAFPSDRESKAGHVLTPSHGLERVRERCPQVTDWTLHDVRRTAATGMREAGIPRVDVAAVLNHTASGDAPRVTGVYDRWGADPEKRTALEAWERRLRDTLAGEKRRAGITSITAGRA